MKEKNFILFLAIETPLSLGLKSKLLNFSFNSILFEYLLDWRRKTAQPNCKFISVRKTRYKPTAEKFHSSGPGTNGKKSTETSIVTEIKGRSYTFYCF
jgi:hypothetical protein